MPVLCCTQVHTLYAFLFIMMPSHVVPASQLMLQVTAPKACPVI